MFISRALTLFSNDHCWLACLQALDARLDGRGSFLRDLEALWEAPDNGHGWLDLRKLSRLHTLSISGLPSLWLPRNLRHLNLECLG